MTTGCKALPLTDTSDTSPGRLRILRPKLPPLR